jgi:DNA primase
MPTVVAAYDNDKSGNEIARAIKQLLPQTTTVRPKAKDWNQELVNGLTHAQEQRLQDLELG